MFKKVRRWASHALDPDKQPTREAARQAYIAAVRSGDMRSIVSARRAFQEAMRR